MQRVFGGDADTVPLVAQHTLTAYVTPEEKDRIEAVRYGDKICYAPVVKSAAAGQIEYRIGDKALAKDTLLYGSASILAPEEKSLTERILDRIFGEKDQ